MANIRQEWFASENGCQLKSVDIYSFQTNELAKQCTATILLEENDKVRLMRGEVFLTTC